jgi:hypothetical protein
MIPDHSAAGLDLTTTANGRRVWVDLHDDVPTLGRVSVLRQGENRR